MTDPTPGRQLLEVDAIGKRYGDFQALHDVSFAVAAGETFAIIGPNGAGKTTLFRIITGEADATSGRIVFDGSDITRLPVHKRVSLGIGRTFQVARVFPDFSAFDNIVVALEARERSAGRRGRRSLAGGPASGVRDEAWLSLARLGLRALGCLEARHLSLGDRKRLELGMSLALDPAVLMMDEPTAGMSPSERRSIVDLIAELKVSLGLTILLTEHDMDLVFELSDRIMVMNQGECVLVGTPIEIRRNSTVREIYLGKEMVHA